MVSIWDKVTYENMLAGKPRAQTITEGIAAGHVEVTLHGRKLKGGFALIRMLPGRGKQDHWLLIKMKDTHARPTRRASQYTGAAQEALGLSVGKFNSHSTRVPDKR